jgi:hypothetical protein
MKNTILKTVFLTTITSLLFSCTKEEIKANLPTLTTATISNISPNSASLDVTIANDGGANITARGICWSTSPTPTVSLSTKTVDGTGTGTFTSQVINLTPGTTYYIRAYATNNTGTSYSIEITFTTLNLSNGLVAYFPLNGNANDASGNGHNGTIYGAITNVNDRNGVSNSAMSWPNNLSSNNYIDIGYLNTFIPNSISISAWILIDGAVNNSRIISSGEQGIIVYQPTNSSPLTLKASYDASGANIWPSTTTISTLQWHHIVYTSDYTSLTAKFYIDGVLTDTAINNSSRILAIERWNIGRKSISAFDGWGGKIDEIRIYNRALNNNEIKYLATH